MKITIKNFAQSLSALCLLSAAGISEGRAQDADTGAPQLSAPKKASTHSRAAQNADKSRVKVLERPAPAAAPATQPAAAAPSNGTAGNEVTRFQGWAVTCFPPPAAGGARSCIAKMNILKSNEDRRPILFISVIKNGGSVSLAVQTPTSVELKGGVNLLFGQAGSRHLDYGSCEPALCTAITPVDDVLANELGSVPNATASWTGLGIGEVRVDFALQEARNMMAFLATR